MKIYNPEHDRLYSLLGFFEDFSDFSTQVSFCEAFGNDVFIALSSLVGLSFETEDDLTLATDFLPTHFDA